MAPLIPSSVLEGVLDPRFLPNIWPVAGNIVGALYHKL